MTLKKKLAVSTLAVSMAAASVAGLPLSGKALGLNNVASAAAVTKIDLISKLVLVNGTMTTADWNAVKAFYNEVKSLSQPEYEKIFAPILAKLELSGPQVSTSFEMFKSSATVAYDVYQSESTQPLDSLRENTQYRDLLNDVASKAQVEKLSFDEFTAFFFGTNGVENELRALVKDKTQSQIQAIINDPSASEALFEQAYVNLLSRPLSSSQTTTVGQVAKNLGITPTDVKTTLYNVKTSLTTSTLAAQTLARAYLRAYPLGLADPIYDQTPAPGTTPVPPAPGVLDASKLVTVTGDKATLALVDADVIKALQNVAAAKGAALTLNLGNVNAATVEAPISKAIIDAAKAAGVANVAVTFNGVTITIPVGQFDAAVTLTVTKENPAVAAAATSMKLASDVYEFGLTVGGAATSSFKQPISIKLPLKNTAGLDRELLSVAKIVYGNIQPQGGVLDGEYIVEPRDTFSPYVVVENKVSFNDIASVQAWAGRQIQVVAAKGAIEGIGSGKFAPKSNVTRAEFAKMLIRALNLENNSAKHSFGDVKSGDWFAPYVAVAAEKGIITGRSAAKFDPNATITRAEMATMIARAVKSIKPDAKTSATALSQFADASKISASLKDGVAFAASNNLVIGSAGKFLPNHTATRAEAAVIIYRTINFK